MIYIFETENEYHDVEAETRDEAIQRFKLPYLKVYPSRPWIGHVGLCDICHADLTSIGVFVDGRTRHGPWAKLCPRCFIDSGIKIGLGWGQLYQRKSDGQFWKIGG